jgi:hypothetical protein
MQAGEWRDLPRPTILLIPSSLEDFSELVLETGHSLAKRCPSSVIREEARGTHIFMYSGENSLLPQLQLAC